MLRCVISALLCIFRGGAVELKNHFFTPAKNEWTASPLNSAKSLEIQGFSVYTKPKKYGQQHSRVGGDAVECFLSEIVWFARR